MFLLLVITIVNNNNINGCGELASRVSCDHRKQPTGRRDV